MRYAYHWNDEATQLILMEERWFQVALELTAHLRHLVIRTGNLSVNFLPEAGAERKASRSDWSGPP